MARFGYTIMGEQAGPAQLVRDATRAEEVGFDFLAASDHYNPWLEEQGHSPYTWSVLGAVAQATESIDLMTYVTCPIIRYHPVVVAQKAATVSVLSGGRFTLRIGAGERLNEHVIGRDWPAVDLRHEMLEEAVQIMRHLLDGEHVTYRGQHFDAEDAMLWDLPDEPTPIGIAVSGPSSCRLAGEHADVMIAVEPKAELGEQFDAAGGAGKPRVGQVGVCFDPDEAAARRRAHEQFRWFSGGWKVNAELPNPTAFDAATSSVTEDEVAAQIACGSDVSRFVDAVRPFLNAGFTDVALVQIGAAHQDAFLDWSEKELLPALREL